MLKYVKSPYQGRNPWYIRTYREMTQPVLQHGLRAAAGAAALGRSCRSVSSTRLSLEMWNDWTVQIYINICELKQSLCRSGVERMQKEFYSSTGAAFATIWNWNARTFVSDHRLASSQSSHCSLPNWKSWGPWHEASLSICIVMHFNVFVTYYHYSSCIPTLETSHH